MNLLHIKYALEVAKTGSINKAAENLYMNQPNLSRAIKELEASVGEAIFDRSTKGMTVTHEGQAFLDYAECILKQVDELQNFYKKGKMHAEKFSVSVPRSGYISEAFSRFSTQINPALPMQIYYDETDANTALHNLVYGGFELAVIRCQDKYYSFLREQLFEKDLKCETVAEFDFVVVMSENSALAQMEVLDVSQLSNYIEIAHTDVYKPPLHTTDKKAEQWETITDKKIFTYERATGLELLSSNKNTFMWSAPQPKQTLEGMKLTQKNCTGIECSFKDILVYKNGYKFSSLDNIFITELCESKRRCIK